MSHRHIYLGIVGLLLGVIGLAALLYPIYLNQYDQYGVKVACGNGFSSDLTQASNSHGDALVTRCDTAVLIRRVWAIPAVALGWLLVTAFLATWAHSGQQQPTAMRDK